MAARTTKALLTSVQALAFIADRGIVCESARRGTIPSLVDAIVGEEVRGNWWSHRLGREIFAVTRAMRAASELLTCRLVDGKITFVHERLWPALVRIADRFPAKNLERLREVHSPSGRHIIEAEPFPDWVPEKISAAAERRVDADAMELFQSLIP